MEQEKSEIEKLRSDLLASVSAMTQSIPQMIMQGQDPSDLIQKMVAVIAGRQKGVALESIMATVFPKTVQPPSTGPNGEQIAPDALGAAPVDGGLQGQNVSGRR